MAQRRLLGLLCCIVFVACRGSGAAPTPSVSTPVPTDEPSPTMSSPTATPAETPTATSGPRRTAPPRSGPPTAAVERDGILVELWLPEEVGRIGERTFAHLRVTNRRKRSIQYEGACGGSLGARLDYSASAPAGRSYSGIAGAFKARLLEEGSYGVRSFVNLEQIDDEHQGCDTVSMPTSLDPDAALERTVALDLVGDAGRPLFPGPATVLGRFAYWPGETHQGEEVVEAEAPLRIEGERTPEYWIVDFVDRALAEPRFAEWLEQQPVETWINTHAAAWPNEDGEYPPDPCYERATDGALGIGLFRDVEQTTQFGEVTLDIPSGELLGVRFEGEGGRVYCE
jgi:hypothetical protein